MRRSVKREVKQPGLSPGALIHAGERKTERVEIHHIDFDSENLVERDLRSVEEAFLLMEGRSTSWLNITGLHDVDLIGKIGARFDIHPLVLEDVLNVGHRPKFEDHGGFHFLVAKMVSLEAGIGLTVEQISLILGPRYLITFQEKPGDVFEPVRNRIRAGKGRIRSSGADYLAYALVDAIVDHYFVLLERIGEDLERLEEELSDDPQPEVLQRVHNLKRDMVFIRKSIWPMREVIAGLERSESGLIRKSTRPFLRDVYDHTIHVIDSVDSFRDVLSGMTELYMTLVSNRMNEVMKVLTIMATIFIPLTFLAGIYGMNFEFMPELSWRWGYPLVWLVMLGLGLGMFLVFKIKKWI